MIFTRRTFLRAGGTAALAAAAGCDQVPKVMQAFIPPGRPNPPGPFQPPGSREIDLVSHCLNRMTFGARPGDYTRVKSLGATEAEAVAVFLEEQLNPAKLDDAYVEYTTRRFEALNEPAGEMFEYKDRVLDEQLVRATLLRAVYSERQLFEVMVQFWTDHFNIDSSKGDCKWLKASDDREVIRNHALGKFPNLLRASAGSPAMLWYLDGRVNRRAKPSDKPNENYARELMELHTMGVHGGYSQRDVMEVARCLTGWTVRGLKQSHFEIGKVEFREDLHDGGRKEVLGRVFPEIPRHVNKEERERLGRQELDQVLDLVAAHPATARHLATKLCRRFISDTPPPGAVDSVADAFHKSGGDISSTLRALFASAEFQRERGNKFKRPFNFIASGLRATNAETDANSRLIEFLHSMGHTPFHYPTPDGYPEEATPWLGTLLWRWNFAVALSENKIPGTRIDPAMLEKSHGGATGLMAHLMGRTPEPAEIQSYHDSGAGLALILAAPAFQSC